MVRGAKSQPHPIARYREGPHDVQGQGAGGAQRGRSSNAPVGRARRGLAVLVVTALVVVGFAIWAAQELSRPQVPPGPAQLDPSAFSPGACLAYPPTTGGRHQTVFLDAGHGGVDPGAVGTTQSGQSVEESKLNLAIELDTMTLLRREGFRVVVSRTRNTSVTRLTPADTNDGVLSLQGSHDDVAARDVCANLAHASVLVGIYMDGGETTSEAGSVSIYDDARPFAAANRRLASLLQARVLATMNAHGWQIPDDGVTNDTTFGSYVGDPQLGGLAAAAASYDHLLLIGPGEPRYFDTPSAMPGAVIEPLYLTDPFEASIAASRSGQQAIAEGIARALSQFLHRTQMAAS
ncbi:MAG: N-acetylmuramoyl-L-alanine amidase [Acidimicrobiales bacterium]